MPNVVGKTSASASGVLKDAGFTNIKIVTKDGGSEAMTDDWTVVAQTPTGGSSAAAGAEIVLTVQQITGKG